MWLLSLLSVPFIAPCGEEQEKKTEKKISNSINWTAGLSMA